jgi:sugar-specific transcriptional regulator TrmB/DNA-binding CsgD family transcriptional regulator
VLEPLGVGDLDERIYRIMLARPHATADELIHSTGSRPQVVAAALKRLEQLGLIRRSTNEPGRYVPAPPDAALEQLISRRSRELGQLRVDANELVADYYAATLNRVPQGLLEIVAGNDAVLRQARALERATSNEILSFDKPPFLVETMSDHDEVGNESPLLDRGIAVRAIYTTDALADGDRFARVSALVARGEQARVLASLPLKLRIFDRQTALVPLAIDVGVMHTVAVVHRSALLEALVSLFELHWERAAPIGSRAPIEDSALNADDQQLLGMLAAGMSDAAIARQFGVSARTARRRTRRLLERLHAATLFQAGAAAVRDGHLPS